MMVVVLVLMSSIGALTIGFHVIEDARMSTLASQVLQSEMENLRLKNWSEVDALPSEGGFAVDTTLDTAASHRFVCVRRVTDNGTDMKQVVLTVSWTTNAGIPRNRSYMTYISKGGLNDYFYRKT